MTGSPELSHRRYRSLTVWRAGIDLVEEIYRLTRKFPGNEAFILSSQLRRAAISVPANIAEGNERRSAADHRRFLTMSQGSVAEVDTELEISTRLGYTTTDDLLRANDLIDQLNRMLTTMRRKVRD